jgi:oligopeptide transport system substrate-binding protein
VSRLAKLAVFTTMLFVVVSIIAACQGQPEPPQSQHPTAVTSQPEDTPEATAAPAAATQLPISAPKSAEMDPDQIFRVSIGGEPPTLDPSLAAWDASYSVIELVFEGLLKFDEELNLQPAIAKEVPSQENGGISEDGKRYIFRLRTDAKFSDGKAVTAKDFEFSIKRLLDPSIAAAYASFYYSIVGAEEYNSSKEKDPARLKALRDAVGVKATDDYTLEIQLKEPRASFLQLTALWPTVPLREDILKDNSPPDKVDKWTDDPKTYVGTGPFKLAEWVHQDHITLVPNEHYYGPKPKLKQIVLSMVADAQAEYAAFLNGEREIGKIPTALFEQIKNDPALSKQLVRIPRLSTVALMFNHQQKPFDNVKVRQALSTAIDREALIDKVQQGVNQPAYSWIPQGMPGHQPDLGQQYKLDPARAKQLLAEAGYPEGQGLPEITLQYPNMRNNPIMAQFLQEQWKVHLGIDVTLEPMESKTFSQAVMNGEYMMGFIGWNGDYPDPDNWLPELFRSGAGNNLTNYSNPEFDDLVGKAVGETDEKKRMDMWAEAQQMIVDDAVMAFLMHQEYFILVPPYVNDLFVTAMDGSAIPGRRSLGQVWLTKK